MDFKKSFNSLHIDSLCNTLQHYEIPLKLVRPIKSFYDNFRCSVGHSNTLFDVKIGSRQDCVMSGVLFNLAIDWVMRKTTENATRSICWVLFSTLDDLDFADVLALLLHTHRHIQEKTRHCSSLESKCD